MEVDGGQRMRAVGERRMKRGKLSGQMRVAHIFLAEGHLDQSL